MDSNKISRPDFQVAEQKIQDDHKKEVERRLSRLAWRSFESDSDQTDKDQGSIPLNGLFEPKEAFYSPDAIDEVEDLSVQTSERLKTAEKVMRDLIHDNFVTSAREYGRLKKAESDNNLMLKNAIRRAKIAKGGELSTRTDLTDIIRSNLKSIEEQKEKLTYESPESYTIVHGMEFRNHIREAQNKKIITTPYVKKNYDRLQKNMEEGCPTFIHGHLGSGKTELAIMAAKHTAISKTAFENAKKEWEKHVNEHPELSKKERRDALGRFYRINEMKLEKALRNGDEEAVNKLNPLVIIGSKDTDTQDLFADKTLKLTKFNGKELLEHKKDLDTEIERWKNENRYELDKLNEKERNTKISEESQKIIELFKLKNQAFGTEVDVVEKAIYQGVKQGRPVIIDEVNTIPAGILLSLNDILQRRPGDQCYIPGIGQVEMKDGFSITMTGNLPSGNVVYRDREELDPAWLSRMDVFEHDYLPMSRSGKRSEQANMEKNELFQAVIANLADRQGNLKLPEMEKSLDKIFALCQIAHDSQLIFKGEYYESIKTPSGDIVEVNLETSVLSIRNLLNVIKKWNKGSEKDLDQALWDGFISQMTVPRDQETTLMIARNHGFFSDKDGWKINFGEKSIDNKISLEQIHPGSFNYEIKPLEIYNLQEVVDAVYGERPEREIYPDDIDFEEIEDLADESVDIDDLIEAEEKIKEVSKTIKALEVLAEQCGCNNTDNSNEAE